MKLSIFTTITNPKFRGDNFKDALQCYAELADELVIIDGSMTPQAIKYIQFGPAAIKYVHYPWPHEFSWNFIGQQFQRGYDESTGDWVIHADLDFIFHQKDFGKIKQAIRDYPRSPSVSFYKWQFILPDRYNLKSR